MRRPTGRPDHKGTANVDVWSADLTSAPALSKLAGLLDDRDRASLMTSRPGTYAPRVGARAALRLVLAHYTGQAATTLRFVEDAYGKPRLARTSVQFSSSRAGGLCVVAVSAGGAVGVDVEARNANLAEIEPLVHRLAPGEATALLALREEDRADGFLRGWTRKEAYLKAVGTALALGLDRCAVSIDDDPQSARAIDGDEGGWALRDLEFGRSHVGAVAVHTGGSPVEVRQLALDW